MTTIPHLNHGIVHGVVHQCESSSWHTPTDASCAGCVCFTATTEWKYRAIDLNSHEPALFIHRLLTHPQVVPRFSMSSPSPLPRSCASLILDKITSSSSARIPQGLRENVFESWFFNMFSHFFTMVVSILDLQPQLFRLSSQPAWLPPRCVTRVKAEVNGAKSVQVTPMRPRPSLSCSAVEMGCPLATWWKILGRSRMIGSSPWPNLLDVFATKKWGPKMKGLLSVVLKDADGPKAFQRFNGAVKQNSWGNLLNATMVKPATWQLIESKSSLTLSGVKSKCSSSMFSPELLGRRVFNLRPQAKRLKSNCNQLVHQLISPPSHECCVPEGWSPGSRCRWPGSQHPIRIPEADASTPETRDEHWMECTQNLKSLFQ